jgi:hypothetical protein
MRLRPRGRAAIVILALILIAIFLPPWINVSRYRARIATSIGNALGRRTTVDSVSLRLLPQPGFDLGGVNIADDPAFGAEPMLHADQVTASLRLSSLWRGRLEIAKLSLKYPSLNLVRAADGRWNVETLLEHASRIPTAPTTKSRPESRPRFPYIEAEGGRINFKLGTEKMVYSLADADFALWLASEDEARTRLTARMVRTDSYLSDTGTFSFEGRFQRAWNLRDTPMSVTASVENAQLGQLTKLLDGLDRGWRGAVDLDLSLKGTPSNLAVSTRADINDFRRYDITSVDRVRLESRCTATFSAPTAQFSDIKCQMPMSDGNLSLRGSLGGILDLRSYNLTLSADKVPLQQLVAVARHAKKNLPEDLSATGNLTAAFTFQKSDFSAPAVWAGSGKTTDAVLRSAVLNPQLALKGLEFEMQGPMQPRPAKPPNRMAKTAPTAPQSTTDYRLAFAPFAVSIGAAAPASVAGWFSLDGYDFTVSGDSDIPRLIQIARTIGVRAPDLNADGSAKLDLALAGKWAGLNSPKPTGTAQLRGVKVRMKGVAAPLQIASATLALGGDLVTASNISAAFADSHLSVAGSVRMPRQCDTIESCPVHFDLHSDQVSTDELNRLFNPRVARRPWYAILGGAPEPSIFRSLNATGNLSITRLAIKSLAATHVSATAQLQAGKLALSNIQADLWGGKHRGQWNADFTADQPTYSGTGTLDSAAMPQLASLMKDNWATGTVTATYVASVRGFTATDLLASATGEINFDWRKGVLRHVSLNGSNAPLSFAHFTGTLALNGGKLTLAPESKLTAESGIYQVSGTASLGRQIDLTLRNNTHAYSVTGTIEKPKVTSVVATESQALLKQ